MMRKSTLVFLLMALHCHLYAQVFEYDDEKAKDRLNHSDTTAGAAHVAAQRSLWSLSSSKDASAWVKPVRRNGRWTTISVNNRASIRVNGRTSNKRTSSGSRQRSSFFLQKQAERAAARAEAARKKEEEKRRRMEENIRDFNMGYDRYKSNMGDYYQNKVAEDTWLHTEGARRLDDRVSAWDLTSPPDPTPPPAKPQGKSGAQLASMLREKKEEHKEETQDVIFVWESFETNQRHQNAIIDKFDPWISLYNNGRLDEWEESRLQQSLSASTLSSVSVKNTSCEVSEVLMVPNFQLPLYASISILPASGPVLLDGNEFCFLEDTQYHFYKWTSNLNVEMIAVCGDRTFVKVGRRVLELIDDSSTLMCEFDTDDFCLQDETDTSFIIFSRARNLSVAVRININNLTFSELVRTTIPIRKVLSDGISVFALVGQGKLMEFSEHPRVVYESTDKINDICMIDKGILLASEKQIVLMPSSEVVYVLHKAGARSLFFDGEELYAITINNKIIRYEIKNC